MLSVVKSKFIAAQVPLAPFNKERSKTQMEVVGALTLCPVSLHGMKGWSAIRLLRHFVVILNV